MGKLNNILQWLVVAEDVRQQAKVKHLMKDIIAIVFLAELANATAWIEIYLFGIANEKFLRKYLELPHRIPSHDTIQRVFAIISPKYLQEFRKRWNEVMSGSMGNKVRKILALDGKTQRGNGSAEQKANHIVSAVDDAGFCLWEVLVDEKSNEITAISELLKALNIKGHIVTIDAMGCQTKIVKLIRKMRGDYLISLKAIKARCMTTLNGISMTRNCSKGVHIIKCWTKRTVPLKNANISKQRIFHGCHKKSCGRGLLP